MGASQIDDEVTYNVSGGLMLENPLTLPFVDAVVSLVIFEIFRKPLASRPYVKAEIFELLTNYSLVFLYTSMDINV